MWWTLDDIFEKNPEFEIPVLPKPTPQQPHKRACNLMVRRS